MEIVHLIVVVIHLLGMAAIIGSVLAVRGKATAALVWGGRIQLITGILLVGLLEMGDETVNHMKVGIKLLVAIAVAACAEIAAAKQRKGESKPELVTAAGALAILNTAIAVLWTSGAADS